MKIDRFQQFEWIICTKIIAEPFSLPKDSTNLDITKLSLHFYIFRALFSTTQKTGYNKIMEESWMRKGEQNEI